MPFALVLVPEPRAILLVFPRVALLLWRYGSDNGHQQLRRRHIPTGAPRRDRSGLEITRLLIVHRAESYLGIKVLRRMKKVQGNRFRTETVFDQRRPHGTGQVGVTGG